VAAHRRFKQYLSLGGGPCAQLKHTQHLRQIGSPSARSRASRRITKKVPPSGSTNHPGGLLDLAQQAFNIRVGKVSVGAYRKVSPLLDLAAHASELLISGLEGNRSRKKPHRWSEFVSQTQHRLRELHRATRLKAIPLFECR
jgi:hypothetical protein